VIFTPVSLLAVRVWDAGSTGAMWCVVGYLALLALVFGWRFRSGRWREIDLTGTAAAPA
jgi:Na+-driven multidrug efflux pump